MPGFKCMKILEMTGPDWEPATVQATPYAEHTFSTPLARASWPTVNAVDAKAGAFGLRSARPR